MAKIKLTKNELKVQKDALKMYKRYLPTLMLKKQQLQTEIRTIDAKAKDEFLNVPLLRMIPINRDDDSIELYRVNIRQKKFVLPASPWKKSSNSGFPYLVNVKRLHQIW